MKEEDKKESVKEDVETEIDLGIAFELKESNANESKDSGNFEIRFNKLKQKYSDVVMQHDEKVSKLEELQRELADRDSRLLQSEEKIGLLETLRQENETLRNDLKVFKYKSVGIEDKDIMDFVDSKYNALLKETKEDAEKISFEDFATQMKSKLGMSQSSSNSQEQRQPPSVSKDGLPGSHKGVPPESRVFRASEIRNMPQKERTALMPEIFRAMSSGRYIKD